LRKGLVISLVILFFIIGSVLFFNSKADVPVAAENQVLETNQEAVAKSLDINKNTNLQKAKYLELKKRPFEPHLIEFYTGKPMKFEKYTLDDVSDGVYVDGLRAHSGKQVFTIYSKDETSETQNLKVKVEENTLKIFVEEEETNTNREKHIVYQTNTSEIPEKYEVFRNNKLEKSEEIIYGIE
jgi:hypothetical protein